MTGNVILSQLTPKQPTGAVLSASTGQAAANAGAGGLTGSWAQRSSSTESTLMPKLKLVPRTGGAIGMETRSVMEYTPVRVDRLMTLRIHSDGSYIWGIQLRRPFGQGCFMVTRQEKRGRLSVSGNNVTFASTDGIQNTINSCTGRSDSAPAPAMLETYAFSRSAGSLRLKGSGGIDWSFTGS